MNPRHVAIIMDGNGRWAEARGQSRGFGHQAGAVNAREIIEEAATCGVEHLTLFAFSTENWRRPPSEVNAIFSVLELFLRDEALALRREGIRLGVIGDLSRLPGSLCAALAETTALTSAGQRMELVLALNYGARAQLAEAARALARSVSLGTLDEKEIHEALLARTLNPARPDPDLIIRTGGEKRLSNFLLWESAYAELYFAEKNWPDFRKDDFRQALACYAERERRYGALVSLTEHPLEDGTRYPCSMAGARTGK